MQAADINRRLEKGMRARVREVLVQLAVAAVSKPSESLLQHLCGAAEDSRINALDVL
jgi:hypothetical protein